MAGWPVKLANGAVVFVMSDIIGGLFGGVKIFPKLLLRV